MAILQTYIHHAGNTADLDRYVFRDGRSLAHDCSMDLEGLKPGGEYGRAMNQWRRDCGKDKDRTAYHFVISPDPKNHASLDQVRALATTWASVHFSDTQWFVGYHDDGATGEIHAHIVVNAVGINGNKIRITKEEWAELANSAHRMTKEFGMYSELRRVGKAKEAEAELTQRDEFRRMAEIKMADRGTWSWKEDIRRVATAALNDCKNFEEYASRLKEQGYRVEITKRGLTYYHPLHKEGSHQYSVKDAKLGALFTRDGIVEKFTELPTAKDEAGSIAPERVRISLVETMRERYAPKLDRTRDPKATYLERFYNRASWQGLQDLQKLADSLRYLREQGLTSAKKIVAEINRIEAAFAPLDQRVKELSVEIDKIDTILKHAYPLEWHTEIIAEYESASFFRRRSMQKEYEIELREHYNAKEWCENHGLDPDTVISEYEAKAKEHRRIASPTYQELEGLEAYSQKLYEAIICATYSSPGAKLRSIARDGFTGHIKRYSLEDLGIVRSIAMPENYRRPQYGRSFSRLNDEERKNIQKWADALADARKRNAPTVAEVMSGKAPIPANVAPQIIQDGREEPNIAYSAKSIADRSRERAEFGRPQSLEDLIERTTQKHGEQPFGQEQNIEQPKR